MHPRNRKKTDPPVVDDPCKKDNNSYECCKKRSITDNKDVCCTFEDIKNSNPVCADKELEIDITCLNSNCTITTTNPGEAQWYYFMLPGGGRSSILHGDSFTFYTYRFGFVLFYKNTQVFGNYVDPSGSCRVRCEEGKCSKIYGSCRDY